MNEPQDIPGAPCPDDDTIAAYLGGGLSPAERERFEAHVADCEACCELLAAVVRTPAFAEQADQPVVVPFRASKRKRVASVAAAALAVAAALLVAVEVFDLGGRPRELPELQGLVAAVGSRRPIEPRLHRFQFGPIDAVMRSGAPTDLDDDVLIAVRNLDRAVAGDRSPAALHALGVSFVVRRQFGRAVTMLEDAAALDPANAPIQTDLCAAYLARAGFDGHAEDLAKALSAAEQATRLDPRLTEAWFNRALALEALRLGDQAVRAWDDYLRVDDRSSWADEAKRKRAAAATRPQSRWQRDREVILRESGAQQVAAVAARIKGDAQDAREYFDLDLLPEWAGAQLAGEPRASGTLAAARALARALTDATGDALPQQGVAAIDRALDRRDGAGVAALARGHRALAEGRRAYDNDDLPRALTAFAAARASFNAGRSPYGIWSDLYDAALVQRRGPLDSAAAQSAQVRDAARRAGYAEVAARAVWITGLIHSRRLQLTDALAAYAQALASFETLGEIQNAAQMHMASAGAYSMLNERRDEWLERVRALEALPLIRSARARHVLLGSVARAAIQQGAGLAALHVQAETIAAAQEWSTPLVVAEGYVQRARILRASGDLAAASQDLDAARATLARVTQDDTRVIESDLLTEQALLHVAAPRDEDVAALTRVLETLKTRELWFRVAHAHLARARLEMGRGAFDAAEQDLRAGIDAFERYRLGQREEQRRIDYAAEGADLYLEMIRFEAVTRARPADALVFAERGRARALLDAFGGDAISPADAPRRLDLIPASTSIVCYSVLEDRVLAWVLSNAGTRLVEHAIARDRLEALVRRHRDAVSRDGPVEEERAAAEALHDAILRPIESALRPGDAIVFVGDGALFDVPYAALVNRATGRFLIEDHPVSLAPSLAVFLAASQRARARAAAGEPSALVLANAAVDAEAARGLSPLPGALREAGEIGRVYATRDLLVGEAASKARFLALAPVRRIVHFAGHAISNPDQPRLSRLLFAPGGGDRAASTLFAWELAGTSFRETQIVVLAGCQTAGGAVARGEGVVNLARAFLSAGVPTVVGTLWDLNDRASVELFTEFHRHVHDGRTPEVAWQQAAIALIRRQDPQLSRPSAWGGVVVVGGSAREVQAHPVRSTS